MHFRIVFIKISHDLFQRVHLNKAVLIYGAADPYVDTET